MKYVADQKKSESNKYIFVIFFSNFHSITTRIEKTDDARASIDNFFLAAG